MPEGREGVIGGTGGSPYGGSPYFQYIKVIYRLKGLKTSCIHTI